MTAHRAYTLGAMVLASIPAACNDQPTSPRSSPAFQLAATNTISGAVLGPDATSICNFIPEGSLVVVRAIDPVAGVFAGRADLLCPEENRFAIGLEAGMYLLRVTLPEDPAIGSLPSRTLTGPLSVEGDAVQDILILPGTPIGGHATFDGSGFEGVDLTLVYEPAPGFGAALGASGTDGTWMEFSGRRSMIAQNRVRYIFASACELLGAQTVEAPPSDPFLFPDELNTVNCRMVTAPAVRFSHAFSRLVVTPMPGDVGGLSGELFSQFGVGWGIQFPVPSSQPPVRGPIDASHLFRGGLMIGIAPDRVLTGADFGGYGACGTCRDLGLDGRVSFSASPRFGKKVIWRYSDESSSGEPDCVSCSTRSMVGHPGTTSCSGSPSPVGSCRA
jgi:hypothetical protein